MSDKKVILVVEDRENWRTTFCNLLHDLGYNVISATCGNEFEKLAYKADVIILDISMPFEENGEEIKTAGLDILIKLQDKNPDHKAIQYPIIRSMWVRDEFKGTKYNNVKVDDKCWCSRNKPNVEFLALIDEIINK